MNENSWIHFVQSEYAKNYLLEDRHINSQRVYFLSDYINKDFQKLDINKYTDRENTCLYNPKKGLDFTQKIMQKTPEIKWLPLQGMSRTEMINTMLKSKVYVDFGNHPGKDRIPREAAACGCCIITGKKGAAQNNIDVSIPEQYKFEDNDSNLLNIKNKIMECIDNYESETKHFIEYREKIYNEERIFEENIKDIFIKELKKR